MQFQIRAATKADLPSIVAIAAARFFHDLVTSERIEEKLFTLRPPGMSIWETVVAEHDQQVVGFLQHAVRPTAKKAWIGIFAVDAAMQGKGVATALLDHARKYWSRDVETAEVLAIPGNYFTPGIDPRYTSGLVWLKRRGFERSGDCCNLRAPLDRDFDTASTELEMARRGVVLRRADRGDADRLDRFFSQIFGDDWRFEVALAMQNTSPALHVALKDDEILGFAAHSGQNRETGFFGPMGTLPAARGSGIGRVLLWHCLNDLRAAGHENAVIPWVGPIDFYHRWAGCTVDRVFWRLQLKCN